MALATGQVIRVWDRQTRPPKFKRLIEQRLHERFPDL